jgi:carbon-monoxide dehydrogenase iron sulfur subunit
MIAVDQTRCTGCRRCEVACAFFRTGRINRQKSRIKVLSLYEIGVDGPVLCCHCQERFCLSCPEKALAVGELGQVIASPTVCNLCGACERLCPIGAIEIFQDIVYVCDLCGGDPVCVKACTEGAITFDPKQRKNPSLLSISKQTKGMTPSQKRHAFHQSQAKTVRKKWRERHA